MQKIQLTNESGITCPGINAAVDSNSVLISLYESGKISTGDLPAEIYEGMMKTKKEKYVQAVHRFKITQGTGKDPRWRTHIEDPTRKNNRKVVAKPTYEELISFLYDHYHLLGIPGPETEADRKAANGVPGTLRELYPHWKEFKKLHTTAETYITRLSSDWNTYYDKDTIIDVPLGQLTKIALETWAFRTIRIHDMTKNCYYNMSTIIRQALDYAVELGIIDKNPFREFKVDGRRLFRKSKKPESETQVFTDEEVGWITRRAWEDYTIPGRKVFRLAPLAVIFQFQTVVRVGELCALKYSDVMNDVDIHIQRMVRRDAHEVTEHTKSDAGDRIVPLTKEARKVLAETRKFNLMHGIPCDGYIFGIGDRPLSERTVADYYAKYCAEIGCIPKSSHCARKTYISTLVDADVNINSIRELVGHADERTTYRNYVYDRSPAAERRKKIEEALAI